MLNVIRKSLILVMIVFSLVFNCKRNITDSISISSPPPPLLPLQDNMAIYVSMDGGSEEYHAGLLVLNANTLQPVDSFNTHPYVPWWIEFSPDYSTWYSIWRLYPSREDYLFAVDVNSMSIINSIRIPQTAIIADSKKKYLIAYNGTGFDIIDRLSFSLVKTDTTIGNISNVTISQNSMKLYFPFRENGNLVGIAIYNLNTFQVDDVIRVFNKDSYPNLVEVDILISPNDRYIFLSAFNWRGGGGFNSFFAIDMQRRKIVAEYPCGPFAQLAVNPDGRYVYISDPAGYLYMMNSTHKVFRYDVQGKSMAVFLTPKKLGLANNALVTDKIIVAPDNRTVFISSHWASILVEEDVWAHIIKVDAFTGKLLGYYAIPLDEQGRLRRHIRNITLGRYLGN